jgi:hypothetical protein
MNVRLQYDTGLLAGIYFEDSLQINSYSVNISFTTQTTDTRAINVAMERLKYFLHGELSNTVFINQAHKEQAEMFYTLGVNITTLPEEPVDQIVGMMLYCKLNAVMENRIVVTSLDISSVLGDDIWYRHDDDDSLGPVGQDGWWHKPSLQHDNIDLDDTPENVVRVQNEGWHELDLAWPEEQTQKTNNTVIYPDFKRNENK